jgi:hypothetical protein
MLIDLILNLQNNKLRDCLTLKSFSFVKLILYCTFIFFVINAIGSREQLVSFQYDMKARIKQMP